MKITKKPRRKGLLIQPDDLQIGECYAVYGLKNGSEQPVPIAGMAFKLVAMNLPFLVGRSAANPALEPVTFDTRFLSFMRVGQDFVTAQRPEAP